MPTISSGQSLTVSAGQTSSGFIVLAGGSLTIASGGEADNTILSGGGETVSSGGLASGTVGFASGGLLVLNNAPAFSATIAGFGQPAKIDLKNIAFNSNTTTLAYSGNTLSGTLTVSDGTRAATLAMLGSYTVTNFRIANDGTGGTLVTDPPVPPAGEQSPQLVVHGSA